MENTKDAKDVNERRAKVTVSSPDGGDPNSKQQEKGNKEEITARRTAKTNTSKKPSGVDCYDPPVITASGILDVAAASLNSHLVCRLCNGYYREPFTVTECFHTFCKSCIFATFHLGFLKCPTCQISLEPDPYKVVISDRTMQELVEKLFPHLQAQDDEDEIQFYRSRGIQKKQRKEEKRTSHSNQQPTVANTNPVVNSSTKRPRCKNRRIVSVDEITFTLLPHDGEHNFDTQSLPPLQRVIRTSGRLKVGGLRKFIWNKLISLDDSLSSSLTPSSIEILCSGDPLGGELSLIFVSRTRWVHSADDFTLTYRIIDEQR